MKDGVSKRDGERISGEYGLLKIRASDTIGLETETQGGEMESERWWVREGEREGERGLLGTRLCVCACVLGWGEAGG